MTERPLFVWLGPWKRRCEVPLEKSRAAAASSFSFRHHHHIAVRQKINCRHIASWQRLARRLSKDISAPADRIARGTSRRSSPLRSLFAKLHSSSKAVKGSLDRASKATEMETIVKGASKATTAQPLKRGGLKEDLAKLNQSFWKALLRCSRDTTSSGEQKQPGGNQEESE